MDIGTGDGRAALVRAVAEPRALVIGVDAVASAMADASSRAARLGPVNALFFAEGAEALGGSPLARQADLVTVTFPWGSLLRGVTGLDRTALMGTASLLREGGEIEVLVSVVPSDGVPGLPCLEQSTAPLIRVAWSAAGLELTSMRPATPAEIRASRSTWARRLGARRPVWRLTGRRLG